MPSHQSSHQRKPSPEVKTLRPSTGTSVPSLQLGDFVATVTFKHFSRRFPFLVLYSLGKILVGVFILTKSLHSLIALSCYTCHYSIGSPKPILYLIEKNAKTKNKSSAILD